MGVAALLALAGCGGGGGGGAAGVAPGPVATQPAPVPAVPPAPPAAPAGPQMLTFEGAQDSTALAEAGATSRFLQAVALVEDPARGEVLASVPVAGGHTLVGLDPVSLQTTWSIAAPSYVSRFVMAGDGSTLYALMPDAKAVWQFDLRTRTTVRIIAMANGAAPLALAVRPGHPETFVVSTGRPELPSPFARAQAYDNGIPRPDWVGRDAPVGAEHDFAMNELAFIDENTLLALDTQTTSCTRQHLDLTAGGLAARDFVFDLSSCFGDRLSTPVPGRYFVRSGLEMDAASMQWASSFPGVYADLGGVTTAGFGFFHPGLKSYVQVSDDDTVAAKFFRIRVDETAAEGRQYIRRRFAAVSDIALATPGTAARSVVVDAVPVGASRIVMAVYDENAAGSPQVMLMAFDLAATAPLPAWDFSTRTAQSGGATGWALRAPAVQVAYDKDMDRLIAALPSVMGPSGNALAVIRPDNGAVERLIPLVGEPDYLSVSAHGSIAYVSVGKRRAVQQVDLKTGTILATLKGIIAGPVVVKPDDPHTVAIVGLAAQRFSLRSYTDLVAAPQGIGDMGSMNLKYDILLGAGDGNQLIAFEELNPPSLWRVNWSSDGLGVASTGPSQLGLGGTTPKMKFGKLSSVMAVADAPTGALEGLLPAGMLDFALDSPTSGVGIVHDYTTEAPALQWFQRPAVPHADYSWDKSAAYVALVDKAFRRDGTYTQVHLVDGGAPGQMIVRSLGLGAFKKDFGPFAGYLYSIRLK